MAKIGEDVNKTLEEIPRRFKLIETVREKFTCRDCEKISHPGSPTSSFGSPIFLPRVCTNCCPSNGSAGAQADKSADQQVT